MTLIVLVSFILYYIGILITVRIFREVSFFVTYFNDIPFLVLELIHDLACVFWPVSWLIILVRFIWRKLWKDT